MARFLFEVIPIYRWEWMLLGFSVAITCAAIGTLQWNIRDRLEKLEKRP